MTGDYVVGGVGLRRQRPGSTASIVIDGVPPDVDISRPSCTGRSCDKNNRGRRRRQLGRDRSAGTTLSSVDGAFGKLLGGGTPRRARAAAADAERLEHDLHVPRRRAALSSTSTRPRASWRPTDPPCVVTGRQGLDALGASLVVVYRDPRHAVERHRDLRRRLHDERQRTDGMPQTSAASTTRRRRRRQADPHRRRRPVEHGGSA